MSGFVLHPEAYQDLDEIWEYIARDNVETADRVLEEIYDSIQSSLLFHIKATGAKSSPHCPYGFTPYEIT